MAMLSKAEPNRLQRRLLTATALGLSLGLNNQAIANPFGTAPVSDGMLSSMRGGYELPNGMLISVGVQIETYVDNSLALRTVLNVTDRAKAALEIVVPSASKLGLSNPQVAAALPASAPVVTNPVAIADPTSIVQATPVVSAIAVAPLAADPAPAAPAVQIAAASSAGDAQMPGVIAPADVQIHSDLGVVTVEQTSSGAAVLLKGPDLQIEHMTGNATGVLIANTLDNRVIDTVATVNISLTDSAIPVGNILLKIESIVLDAVGTNM
ncbi:MAG TPA: hypothetical protein VJ762_04370 [Sphingobium sp.]|nr:hypothetical protein [Sphingobium sp.]